MEAEEQTATPGEDQRLIEVAAGIIWRGETFLAAERTEKRDLAHLWEFPGGKCEAGEKPEDTLCRELKEELNITVLASSLWQTLEHSYPEYHYRVRLYFFHVRSFQGEPEARENQGLRWVTPAEAMQLPFVPADQPILTQLGSLRLLSR